MKRTLASLAALAVLACPSIASADYPDASYSAARVKEWQNTKHVECNWLAWTGQGCRNQQVVYNERVGEHSRLIGVYIEYNGNGTWNYHYDCVRRDHYGNLSFWGHNPCWGI